MHPVQQTWLRGASRLIQSTAHQDVEHCAVKKCMQNCNEKNPRNSEIEKGEPYSEGTINFFLD